MFLAVALSMNILMPGYSQEMTSEEESSTTAHTDLVPEDYFNLSLDELLNIKVTTASKLPEPISRSTSNIVIITEADLRKMGARTYQDALALIPGFVVGMKNLGEKTISLRGIYVSDSPGTLILLNGHVLNGARTGGASNQYLDELPVENIRQIEIIRGPGSALYGANAFLGLINIITKDADDIDGISLTVGSELESGSSVGQHYNLLYGNRFKNGIGLSLNMNWLDESGHDLEVNKDSFGHSGHAFSARERVDIQSMLEIGELRLRTRYFHRQADGFFGINHVLANGNNLSTYGGYLEAQWTHDLGNNLELKTNAYIDHIATDNYYLAMPPGAAPANSFFSLWNTAGYIGNPQIEETYLGGELQLTYSGFNKHTITGGIVSRYESQHDAKLYANFNPLPLTIVRNVSGNYNWMENAHRDIWSLYIQDIWDITDDFRLTAGIRFDEFSDFGFTANPRVGLLWKLSERLDLKFAYGTAFRAPDFGAQFIRNNPIIQGNPDLGPEEIQTCEVSLSYTWEDRFHTTITYFHSELDDLIQIPANRMKFENLRKVRVDGIEIEGRYHFKRGGHVMTYFTYNESELAGGRRFSDIPRKTVGAELNIPLGEHLNWNINGYWQDSSQRAYGDIRSDLDGYGLVNTTLLLKWPGKDHEMRFSVFNVFDEDYAFPAPPATLRDDYTAPGTSFVIEARLSF